MKSEQPTLIIAIRGYRATGKTTVAKALSEALPCPVINYNEILDVLSPTKPPPERVKAVKSHAYDIVTQVVKAHVSLGFSVIIDSTNHTHINKLVALLKDLQENSTVAVRLIVIRCNPHDINYFYQNLVDEGYDEKDPGDYKWYSPYFYRDQTDLDIDRDDAHPGMYSKLEVDTGNPVQPELLAEAIRDLTKAGATPELVLFKDWLRLKNKNGEETTGAAKQSSNCKGFCTDGHRLDLYSEQGFTHYAICPVCGQRILTHSPAYACRSCSLALHKSCAELQHRGESEEGCKVQISFKETPEFYDGDPVFKSAMIESFPEKHLCFRCRLLGNDFSNECASCLFHSHLRCQLMPTILTIEDWILEKHTVDHSLFLRVRPAWMTPYRCAACLQLGNFVAYECIEGCDIHYHPRCTLFPKTLPYDNVDDPELELIQGSSYSNRKCEICGGNVSNKAWYYKGSWKMMRGFSSYHLHCLLPQLV